MSLQIIIRGKTRLGKTRSEQEKNLRQEWGSTITDEQLDKVKFLEKKAKENLGLEQNFIHAIDANKVE
jgi:hypothetical protein